MQNATATVPPREGRFDVAAGIGQGTLVVVRDHASWREPYTGIVRLETGEIAEDLARYLTESEQSPSAIGLAVGLGRDGCIDSAAGFWVRALPGGDDATVAAIEQNVRTLPNAAELVRMGFDADRLLDHLVRGVGCETRHRSRPVFSCPCTRERALETLSLLGSGEIREILDEGDGQEVCCHFCGEAYQLSGDELRARFADA